MTIIPEERKEKRGEGKIICSYPVKFLYYYQVKLKINP
jgi:hypothetical protein